MGNSQRTGEQPKAKKKKINSRRKGANGELNFAHFLKSLGVTARRAQQYCGSNGDADVISSLPVHWEVKRTERLNLDKAISQAKKDSNGKDWAVAHRKNKGDWVIVCDAKLFIDLYKFVTEYEP